MKTKLLPLFLLVTTTILIGIGSCKKENPQLGEAPSEADALFTYAPSDTNDNVIIFTAANPDMINMWDFGNGLKGEGSIVSAVYPNAGVYPVSLGVFNSGGSKTSIQDITISQTDPSLLDNPIFTMLTGGVDGPGYRSWYIDSSSAGHFGVGPDPVSDLGYTPEWWSAPENAKPGCGIYDDRYVFYLNAYRFDMVTNGDVYVHNTIQDQYPGAFENLADFTAPYDNRLNESWSLTEEEDTTISVSGDSFIGFGTGVNTYKIIELTDTSMYLAFGHHEGGLLWYLKLKPEI
ncbi:MAG: PKD domain-containing protein [Crocinitomicaceae bacterium]|mgnify:FL=1